MNTEKSVNRLLFLFTLVLAISILLPGLLKKGMFMDGLMYASISRNLGFGLSDFWLPHFSDSWTKNNIPYFLEQPPLGFGIQGIFFKALGNHWLVERFYSSVLFILSAMLVISIWKRVTSSDSGRQLYWLPLIIWITIPVATWSVKNNMLENTMVFFCLASFLFWILNFQRKKTSFILLFAASLSITAAGLTKGIQGMFPIITPVAYAFFFHSYPRWRAVKETLLAVSIIGVTIAVLLQFPAAEYSLTTYLRNRVLNSIENVSTGEGRFHLLGVLVLEMLPVILACILCWFIYYRKHEHKNSVVKQSAFFLTQALAGSLPLMITLEQRRFYIVTSLPFYALAAGAFLSPLILSWYQKIDHAGIRRFRTGILFASGVAVIIAIIHLVKPGRDHQLIRDIDVIAAIVAPGKTVSSSTDVWYNWSVQGYFQREHLITVDPDRKRKWHIQSSLEAGQPEGYQKVQTGTSTLFLFKKH